MIDIIVMQHFQVVLPYTIEYPMNFLSIHTSLYNYFTPCQRKYSGQHNQSIIQWLSCILIGCIFYGMVENTVCITKFKFTNIINYINLKTCNKCDKGPLKRVLPLCSKLHFSSQEMRVLSVLQFNLQVAGSSSKTQIDFKNEFVKITNENKF